MEAVVNTEDFDARRFLDGQPDFASPAPSPGGGVCLLDVVSMVDEVFAYFLIVLLFWWDFTTTRLLSWKSESDECELSLDRFDAAPEVTMSTALGFGHNVFSIDAKTVQDSSFDFDHADVSDLNMTEWSSLLEELSRPSTPTNVVGIDTSNILTMTTHHEEADIGFSELDPDMEAILELIKDSSSEDSDGSDTDELEIFWSTMKHFNS